MLGHLLRFHVLASQQVPSKDDHGRGTREEILGGGGGKTD
jgi:hypothetical protein